MKTHCRPLSRNYLRPFTLQGFSLASTIGTWQELCKPFRKHTEGHDVHGMNLFLFEPRVVTSNAYSPVR